MCVRGRRLALAADPLCFPKRREKWARYVKGKQTEAYALVAGGEQRIRLCEHGQHVWRVGEREEENISTLIASAKTRRLQKISLYILIVGGDEVPLCGYGQYLWRVGEKKRTESPSLMQNIGPYILEVGGEQRVPLCGHGQHVL